MMLRAGLAVIFLLAQAGAVAAQNRVLSVLPPRNQCFDILELEKIEITGDGYIRSTNVELLGHYRELAGWIWGYITARNLYDTQFLRLGGSYAKELNRPELMRWIFSYCRANPTKNIADAALELTETLRKAKP